MHTRGIRKHRHSTGRQPAVDPRERALLRADWDELLMVHFAVTPEAIQARVPQPLDTRDGEAFVTLVAFRQRQLRFDRPGRWARALARPVDEHAFLNVRTYVRGPQGPGIWFMREFINNPLARLAGPLLYGLPYRLAAMRYRHRPPTRHYAARVSGLKERLSIEADYALAPLPAADVGSLEQFLHERYVAYTGRGRRSRRFRVWHEPWRMHRARARIEANGPAFDWMGDARPLAAFFTPGMKNLGLGGPVAEPYVERQKDRT